MPYAVKLRLFLGGFRFDRCSKFFFERGAVLGGVKDVQVLELEALEAEANSSIDLKEFIRRRVDIWINSADRPPQMLQRFFQPTAPANDVT